MNLLNCISSNSEVMLKMLHFVTIFALQITTLVLQTPNWELLTNFECSYNKKYKTEDCILNDRSRLLFGDRGIRANNHKIIQEELSLSCPWTRWALSYSLLLCFWCLHMLQDICNLKTLLSKSFGFSEDAQLGETFDIIIIHRAKTKTISSLKLWQNQNGWFLKYATYANR